MKLLTNINIPIIQVDCYSAPKLYANNQAQVDEVLGQVMAQVEEVKGKVVAMIPNKAVKKEE